ncbi:MAG: type II toxin-antitoxin system MqsA family antitoxin [Chloroflexi bacterium]|nr:type II toxin-antitoxin system MqsA family antitoxin [Chloroflexota bacterium]
MNLIIKRCPTCGSDQIKKVCRDWTGNYKGQSYVVPDLTFYECPVCEERVFEREALSKIQAHSPAFAKRQRRVKKIKAAQTAVAPRAIPHA